jgi:hypothetical protein
LKEIYLVAGERNMLTARAQGGLWANVGETRVGVESRLRGDDYRRKAAGGAWRIISRWRVPDDFSDRDIHRVLKRHRRVTWVPSSNTEEFFFEGDEGDGSVAVAILEGLIPSRESHIGESIDPEGAIALLKVYFGCLGFLGASIGGIALLTLAGILGPIVWLIMQF